MLRVRFAKDASVAGLSHQEFGDLLRDAVDRAGLPVVRGGGGKARPRLVQSPSLSLGHRSRCEYADFPLSAPVPAMEFGRRLDAALPEGVRVVWQWRLQPHARHLRAATAGFCYTVPGSFDKNRAETFLKADTWPFTRVKNGKERVLDLARCVSKLVVHEDRIVINVRVQQSGTPKPEEILESVFGIPHEQAHQAPIERTSVLLVPEPRPSTLDMELL